MRNGICVQRAQSEVWRLVHQAPIFSAQGEVMSEWKIRAATVNECRSRLRVGSSNQGVAAWIEC